MVKIACVPRPGYGYVYMRIIDKLGVCCGISERNYSVESALNVTDKSLILTIIFLQIGLLVINNIQLKMLLVD